MLEAPRSVRRLARCLTALLHDRRGSAYVEYLVLVAVCALALVATYRSWSGTLRNEAALRIAGLAASGEGAPRGLEDLPPPPSYRPPRPGTIGNRPPSTGARPGPSRVPAPSRGVQTPVCRGGSCTRPGQCFAAGTQVLTATGDRAIETIEVGDQVWSRDEQTGAMALRTVLQTFVTESAPVLQLELRGALYSESLTVTPNHPVWVEERGWVAAGELGETELLWSPEGALAAHAGASWGARAKVYNFEVDEYHTYFVGTQHAWVHNAPAEDCGNAQAPGPNGAPQDYLDYALRQQGLETAPASLKQKWEDNEYKYEVRVHPAEGAHGKTGSIYRVARQSKWRDDRGQGLGMEYQDQYGQWHFERDLKNDEQAAADTHIQLPPNYALPKPPTGG